MCSLSNEFTWGEREQGRGECYVAVKVSNRQVLNGSRHIGVSPGHDVNRHVWNSKASAENCEVKEYSSRRLSEWRGLDWV